MGFLNKLGKVFVEEIPDENEFDLNDIELPGEEDVLCEDVNTESVNYDSMVEDIYKSNGMEDKSSSIFKVEEIIQSLPKEMPNVTKKTTVSSILKSFGLDSVIVSEDGMNRVQLLKSAFNKIQAEITETIIDKKSLIEEHKKEIEQLEKEIALNEEYLKQSEAAYDNENKRINELVQFIMEEEKE